MSTQTSPADEAPTRKRKYTMSEAALEQRRKAAQQLRKFAETASELHKKLEAENEDTEIGDTPMHEAEEKSEKKRAEPEDDDAEQGASKRRAVSAEEEVPKEVRIPPTNRPDTPKPRSSTDYVRAEAASVQPSTRAAVSAQNSRPNRQPPSSRVEALTKFSIF